MSDRVHDIISRMTFPPKIRYKVEDDEDGIHVVIRMYMPIRDSQGKTDGIFNLTGSTRINVSASTDAEIAKDIFHVVMAMHCHEVKEWMSFDGKYIFPPHPELHEDEQRKMVGRMRETYEQVKDTV